MGGLKYAVINAFVETNKKNNNKILNLWLLWIVQCWLIFLLLESDKWQETALNFSFLLRQMVTIMGLFLFDY